MTTYNITAGSGLTTINNFKGAAGITDAAQASLVDILKLSGTGLTAENMLVTQSGADTLITFNGVANTTIKLTNFSMFNLGNDLNNTSVGFVFGNVMFTGETAVSRELDTYASAVYDLTLPHGNAINLFNADGNFLYGTDTADIILSGHSGDYISTLQGNDLIRAGGGVDNVIAGSGDDTIYGGDGDDSLDGDNGYDNGTADGADTIYAGNGSDYIMGRGGNDKLYGEAGSDYMWGGRRR